MEHLHLELADPVAVPVGHALEFGEELLAALWGPLLGKETGRVPFVACRQAFARQFVRDLAEKR